MSCSLIMPCSIACFFFPCLSFCHLAGAKARKATAISKGGLMLGKCSTLLRDSSTDCQCMNMVNADTMCVFNYSKQTFFMGSCMSLKAQAAPMSRS